MKKYIIALLALCLFSVFALANDAFTLATDTSAQSNLTTKLTVARIQGDPAPDGSLTLTVFLKYTVTAADGTVVAMSWLTESLNVPVNADLAAALSSAIAKAKQDTDAAKAASTPAPQEG